MFELIDLHTRDYDVTADVDPDEGDKTYVATARVPAMSPPPDILVWGSRSFLNSNGRNSRKRLTYIEAFATAVIHTVPIDSTL